MLMQKFYKIWTDLLKWIKKHQKTTFFFDVALKKTNELA